jgi:predicted RNA binding protein YcfA (HicA-like mRNA interferase family)
MAWSGFLRKGIRFASSVPRNWTATVKIREIIRKLRDDGWREVRVAGSHRHFAHETKPGLVTVSGRESLDIPTGTLRSIFRQAGLDWTDRRQ